MLLLLLALVPLIAGCSGVNAGGSVSPATFLLPGLMQNEPEPTPLTVPEAPTDSV
jgi:hypothetical protein